MSNFAVKTPADSQTTNNRIRAELAAKLAIASAVINPLYISLEQDQNPVDYEENTGPPIGVKPVVGNGLQIVKWIDDEWQDVGGSFADIDFVTNGLNEIQIVVTDIDGRVDTVETGVTDINNLLTSVNARVTTLENNQVAGLIGYKTFSDLEAVTPTAPFPVGFVANDADIANNGYYTWDGQEEEWVKAASTFDSVLNPLNNDSAPGGNAIADYVGMPTSGAKVEQWARAEQFSVSGTDTISSGDVELPKNIKWPDGKTGTLSNLSVSDGSITSLRFNYDSTTKYITLTVDYSGTFPAASYTQTGF